VRLYAQPHDLHYLGHLASARVRAGRSVHGVGLVLLLHVHWPKRLGIRISAKINTGLAVGMCVVVAIFFVAGDVRTTHGGFPGLRVPAAP